MVGVNKLRLFLEHVLRVEATQRRYSGATAAQGCRTTELLHGTFVFDVTAAALNHHFHLKLKPDLMKQKKTEETFKTKDFYTANMKPQWRQDRTVRGGAAPPLRNVQVL